MIFIVGSSLRRRTATAQIQPRGQRWVPRRRQSLVSRRSYQLESARGWRVQSWQLLRRHPIDAKKVRCRTCQQRWLQGLQYRRLGRELPLQARSPVPEAPMEPRSIWAIQRKLANIRVARCSHPCFGLVACWVRSGEDWWHWIWAPSSRKQGRTARDWHRRVQHVLCEYLKACWDSLQSQVCQLGERRAHLKVLPAPRSYRRVDARLLWMNKKKIGKALRKSMYFF